MSHLNTTSVLVESGDAEVNGTTLYDDLKALLEYLGIVCTHLIGHSFGGNQAMMARLTSWA